MRATLASNTSQLVAGAIVARKYRLERQLGEGSQGSVWQAHNLALDLPVAVKLVHALSEGERIPERLFREARSAAVLGHPAIVRVFDFGETAQGLPFLVMELLQGESLADYLSRAGRIRAETALRLLLPIADGLAAAHARGIVHRDVKPDNVFLSLCAQLIQPKLLDFGIARLTKGENSEVRLTRTGAVLGTPNYLPPEQARGLAEVDQRADIWSLSATLYECITGAAPFQADSWIEILRRILEDEPRPLGHYGVEDDELWELLRRGLAKDPAQRWPDIHAFGSALASWLLNRGVTCDVCGVSVEARWLHSRPQYPLELPHHLESPCVLENNGLKRHLVRDITRRIEAPLFSPALSPKTPARNRLNPTLQWVLAIGTALLFTAGSLIGLNHLGAARTSRASVVTNSAAGLPTSNPTHARAQPSTSSVPTPSQRSPSSVASNGELPQPHPPAKDEPHRTITHPEPEHAHHPPHREPARAAQAPERAVAAATTATTATSAPRASGNAASGSAPSDSAPPDNVQADNNPEPRSRRTPSTPRRLRPNRDSAPLDLMAPY